MITVFIAVRAVIYVGCPESRTFPVYRFPCNKEKGMMVSSRFAACFTFASIIAMKDISVAASDADFLARAGRLNLVTGYFTDNVHKRIYFSSS